MVRPRALQSVWIFGLHDSDAMGSRGGGGHRQENADPDSPRGCYTEWSGRQQDF